MKKRAINIKRTIALLAGPLAAVGAFDFLSKNDRRVYPSQATGLTSGGGFFSKTLCLAIAALFLPGCASNLQSPDFFTRPRLPLQTRLSAPRKHELVRGQLVVHSDFEMPGNHRLLDDLIARRSDLSRKLSLPTSDEAIHVYLFEDAEQYDAFMRVRRPNALPTRAGFQESDTRLEVYAYWGDRVAEDLRHEVMHGYIHSVVPNAPLWLDEGLAEYFEVPRGTGGLNKAHIRWLVFHLSKGDWRPDLARLERLTPLEGMSRADYAEAWAWVHYLLQSEDPAQRELLGNHLRHLRQHGSSEPLSRQLAGIDQMSCDGLIMHIQRLAAESSAESPASE